MNTGSYHATAGRGGKFHDLKFPVKFHEVSLLSFTTGQSIFAMKDDLERETSVETSPKFQPKFQALSFSCETSLPYHSVAGWRIY